MSGGEGGEINGDISQGSSPFIAIPIQENTSKSDKENWTMEENWTIMEMLHLLPSETTIGPINIRRSYISRVHSELRSVKEKAYEPILVSIGPYHYERRESDLRTMETHKLRYLDDLMKRREKKKSISKTTQLSEYFQILRELEDEARSYYEEPSDLDQDAFIKMLLVDACFIIELFQRATIRIDSDIDAEIQTDPLLKANWIIKGLKRDLILVENQIPFFVLERLYPIIGETSDPLDFILMVVTYLPVYYQQLEFLIAVKSIGDLYVNPIIKIPSSMSMLLLMLGRSIKLDREKLKGFKHLLDLTRKFMLIEENLEIKGESRPQPDQKRAQESKETALGPTDFKRYTHSATELLDLGVRFKVLKHSKFYDITFDDGVLEIPVFNIDHITESLFRNLIAYEEHGHCEEETIYIGNYITFMDGLIDTAKDVKLLRHCGIINGYLGDDEEIATMFNTMAKNVILMYYYYGEIVQQINEYCMKRNARVVLSHWMVIIKHALMQNFLNSPWKIMSVFAATILLVLTLSQTVYSVLSYNKA